MSGSLSYCARLVANPLLLQMLTIDFSFGFTNLLIPFAFTFPAVGVWLSVQLYTVVGFQNHLRKECVLLHLDVRNHSMHTLARDSRSYSLNVKYEDFLLSRKSPAVQ